MTATRTRNQIRQRGRAPAPPSPPAVPTRAADLRSGHAVRIAGYGTLPVAAEPGPVLPPLV
ncbi:hypothetical protein E1267_26555, partial [Nonomuraea longispora]